MSRDAINLDTPQLGHYGDAIMGTISSQVTNLTIVYSIVHSDADQRKHQSSASLAFVREIHRGPVAKWPLTSSCYCSFHSADRWYISTEYFVTSMKCVIKQWASSTGLTAVSKFKPRLPAQWTVGTHRKGPSRMEKVTSRINWPIRNTSQIRNQI